MDIVKIKKVFPKISDAVIDAILTYAPKYGLTDKDIPMFMAQAGVESQGFTKFEENLNYSDYGLAQTWPSRYAKKGSDGKYIKVPSRSNPKTMVFVPNDLAIKIQKNPREIANLTYGNRNGNRGYASGDGWQYRGRGIFMLTFLDNYKAFQKDHPDIKILENPDLVKEPSVAVITALWYWKKRQMTKYSNDILGASMAVNGGTIGLPERKANYNALTA